MTDAGRDGPSHVLVAEDDRTTADLVAAYLRREGYRVTVVHDGDDALRRVERDAFDLLVLDVMLPGTDGLEVCRRARVAGGTPVILLTARTREDDRIEGLDLGADDYVTKPFLPRELMARVRAVLRRAPVDHPDRLSCGPLVLEPASLGVSLHGVPVELTATEFALLERLVRAPGVVHGRAALLAALPEGGRNALDRTIDVHVRNMRRKFTAAGDEAGADGNVIETVVGVGYRIAAALRIAG